MAGGVSVDDSPPRVAVAVSGGRDSLALLRTTMTVARALGMQVLALHVHHGLMPEADAWAAQLRQRCARWARVGWPLNFAIRRLSGRPDAGDSVEAWARRERYRALAEMAREGGAPLVLLAHHQRDQAETFLLQALRGAGPAGLAAMPRLTQRDGITWARPWLSASNDAIDAVLKSYRLAAVNDPSNADPRFARSRLRHHAMAALRADFLQADASLAQSASRAQEARECLAELAALDLGEAGAANALELAAWVALAPARRANALRHWLQATTGRGAEESLVQRLLRELPRGRGPAAWQVADGWLRRYRGALVLESDVVRYRGVDAPGVPSAAIRLALPAAGSYAVPPWQGELRLTRVPAGGVALATLVACELRPRPAAQRFQRMLGTPQRSLKKQFQDLAVPAWQRDGPLLFAGDRLIFVAGLGIDARARAPKGVPQVSIEWLPSAR